MEKTLNITTNLNAVESIKSEILSELAMLYSTLGDYGETDVYDEVLSGIATIIAMDYILARRLGITFDKIDEKICEFTSIAGSLGHELEKDFSDMSELKNYIGR